MRFPLHVLGALTLLFGLHSRCAGLQVRAYSQALHNRLVSFPGAPIFPQTPAVNPTFSPAGGLFLGIGWPAHPTDWTRQMALVSPRHFVYATHYVLGADWQIAFLGADGQQHLYGIESQIPVVNDLGQTTDLMVCTLTSAVSAETGIKPFPVLNLPTEADYLGKEMVVFGSFVRAGKTPLAAFTNLVDDPGFDTTRFAYFDYDHNGGGADECDYQGGDSGAPTFIMNGGSPAIIGTASGRDPQGWGGLPLNISRNYLAFIPAYLPQVDQLMENQGYHMKRARPAATTLLTETSTPVPLRRMKPGQVEIRLSNTGSAAAHNVSLGIEVSNAPSTVGGAGSFCDPVSPLKWNCRRAGLSAASQSVVTVSWNSLPDASEIHATIVRNHDGGTAETLNLTWPLTGSYASWIQGTSDSAENSDPDHDGMSNLMEYAFGGLPSVNSPTATGGHPLMPQVEVSSGRLWIRHPRRTDAAARGISYGIEFSNNPAAASWQETPPPGTTVDASPYTPPSPGFEQVTVSVPIDAQLRFARVKVTLAE